MSIKPKFVGYVLASADLVVAVLLVVVGKTVQGVLMFVIAAEVFISAKMMEKNDA